MKIGVISDTHLKQATPAIKSIVETYFKDTDLILHAGDMVALPVYEFLQNWPVEAVQGNMDDWHLKSLLPVKRTFTLKGFHIGLAHGWGPPGGLEGRLLSEFTGIDCLVYGHSHQPANHWVQGVLLFNPGSASGIGFFGKPTIGLLHLNSEIRGEIIEI
jgi:putative phosphoesterase